MSDPVFVTIDRLSIRRFMPVVFLFVFILFSCGVSFASSSSGHEDIGWVSTDTYRVFNFVILATGVFLAVRKPLTSALKGRIKGIKSKLEELEIQKSKIEAELERYDSRLAELDKEAESILAEYTRQGEAAKVKILAEAEIAAERLKDQAKRNIKHEFEQAKTELRRNVVDKALVKAEEIIKKQIDLEDQERLVDEYLEKVVA